MLLYKLLEDPIQFLLVVPCILIALTFHEWAHGYAAMKCGDMTARNLGRLSLNPLHHLDLAGSLMMLLVGFGWAKPVPINPRNFRNPKRDFAIVAIAGPLMNILIAFVSSAFAVLSYNWFYSIANDNQLLSNVAMYSYYLFYYLSMLNVGLAVFNLIPLPPLDGSRVVSALLPPNLSVKYNRIQFYARYIILGIVILTWLPAPFSKISDLIFWPVDWLRSAVLNGFYSLWELIF